ncbi:MAG TPA: hypothetical protein VK186_15620 [Candidatus Deferrimicrobium sp.]|nr:hypothetical protein [Candidatus Deferrimicrobium sp.]
MEKSLNSIKRPLSNKVSWRRDFIDPVSDFLELNLSDSFQTLRYYFHLEYCRNYTKWANGRIHNQNVYDTDKCEYLANIAESRLKQIVHAYPRKFWIDAFRCMDLHALFMIFGEFSLNALLQYISIGSLEIVKFSILNHTSETEFPERIEDILSLKKMKYAKRNFPIDLGKFLGAILTLAHAQQTYRFAGKGGELIPPTKMSMKDFPDFEKFPKDNIFIMPSVQFVENPKLEQSISIYEKRRDDHKGLSFSGFYKNPTLIQLADSNWWQIGILGEPFKFFRVIVSYPSLKMKIFSKGYIVLPKDISEEIKLLIPFEDNFELSFGFDFNSFCIMCQNLFNFVYEETGFSKLHIFQLNASDECYEITSKLSERSIKTKTAPLHLYHLFARGIFKTSKDVLTEILMKGLKANGENATKTANRFIKEFTCRESNIFNYDLTPWIFYSLDEEVLAIDFIRANEFMEACLWKVSRTGGKFPNIRGDIFAKQARDFLIKKLSLKPENMPLKPEKKMKIGNIDYGDVDFAFVWKEILIHIDMKSHQKSSEYLRGNYSEVRNRQMEAQQQMSEKSSNIDKRGMKLLEIINNKRELKLSGVLNFICVPHPLYISIEYGNLWYEDIPRVLTPSELAHIMADAQRILQLKNLIK